VFAVERCVVASGPGLEGHRARENERGGQREEEREEEREAERERWQERWGLPSGVIHGSQTSSWGPCETILVPGEEGIPSKGL
jgi:hypothetical protein